MFVEAQPLQKQGGADPLGPRPRAQSSPKRGICSPRLSGLKSTKKSEKTVDEST